MAELAAGVWRGGEAVWEPGEAGRSVCNPKGSMCPLQVQYKQTEQVAEAATGTTHLQGTGCVGSGG